MSSCDLRHSLVLVLPFFPLPVLVFLVFLELASSSGYSSRRALLTDRVDSSGRPTSESSQSSKSGGRSMTWACCMIVMVPFLLPPAALAFSASFAFVSLAFAAAVVATAAASAFADAAAAATSVDVVGAARLNFPLRHMPPLPLPWLPHFQLLPLSLPPL